MGGTLNVTLSPLLTRGLVQLDLELSTCAIVF